jgi:hypothetical protein
MAGNLKTTAASITLTDIISIIQDIFILAHIYYVFGLILMFWTILNGLGTFSTESNNSILLRQ